MFKKVISGKFFTIFCLVSLSVFMLISCKKEEKKLIVYSYNSFSWAKNYFKDFEEKYDCKVELDTSFTDTGDMLSKVILQKKSPKVDVVIGVTPAYLGKLKKENLLLKYKSHKLDQITNKELIFDNEGYSTPYDYGALAIIYDPAKIKNLNSFSDIYKNEKQLIIQNPKISSTGLDFFLWTIAIYGNNWENEWKNIKKGILTVTPGWSEAFSKFENGEAPMMVSYATDPAYSYEYYKSEKYKAFIPEEGGYIQIEGVSIIKNTKNRKLAEAFVDYMLSENFQKNIPLNQWMFPVINIELPESFKYAIKPQKILTVDQKIYDELPTLLDKWEKIINE